MSRARELMTRSSGKTVHLGAAELGDSGGPTPQPGERHCPLAHIRPGLSEGLAIGGWGPREEEWPPYPRTDRNHRYAPCSLGFRGQAPLTVCAPVAAGCLENLGPQGFPGHMALTSTSFQPVLGLLDQSFSPLSVPVSQARPCPQLQPSSLHKPPQTFSTQGLGSSTLPSTLKFSASQSSPLGCFQLMRGETSFRALKPSD